MPSEVIVALSIKSDGIYIDGTLGGGGHSALIIERLKSGKLFGIDRDESAIKAASDKIISENFVPIRGNFQDMPVLMDKHGISQGMIDGILLDLGVSSHQIDTPERGFSFRTNGPLDMRMDRATEISAKEIINTYSEKELAKIFFEFGEERHSRKIAREICKFRENSQIETTEQLAAIIEKASPPQRNRQKSAPHPAMRTFMALRIAVNDELSPLSAALQNAVKLLAKGGRIAVITFHSLEDRIVKTTFAKLASPCECPRDIPYCVCGKEPSLRVITRKPMLPTSEELSENSRAHSAKLRIAEKV
ncbi:MAG: 16S rRNA (cytosine(1402)-N(4))-methyltransferase RsmH [Defluviitaleaceae bacterium]|nr:16S rRNA (cytosine(1402)-N(4))-methyltransferase RsmH [Defluviitaleaceae bacterium]